MPIKLTAPVIVRFDDEQMERQRRNHEARITELAKVVSDITKNETSEVPTTTAPGRWLGRQILNKTSGAYTSTPGTHTRLVRQIGGGGGGGGALGAIDASGGSGNSGWALEYRIIGEGINGTYTIGAGGAAGTAAPTAGGAGGDTTFVINGKTYIAKGGTGGGGGTNINATAPLPAAGSTQPPDVDYVWYGPAASGGQSATAQVVSGGGGGAAPFGGGGPPSNAGPGSGQAGFGFGSGASGAAVNGFSSPGAAGTAGIIVVDEYS